MRLEPIIIGKEASVEEVLTFYMGKNTQKRQEFIIENLRVEKDLIDEQQTNIKQAQGFKIAMLSFNYSFYLTTCYLCFYY